MEKSATNTAGPRWGIAFPRPNASGEGLALVSAPLPEQLIIPLNQNIGFAAQPIVNIGDKVLMGEPIAEIPASGLSARVHAPASGMVTRIIDHEVPGRGRAQCVVIATDGKDEQWPGYESHPDPLRLPAARLRNAVIEAGIVGLGGAMFPAAIKLNPGTGVETLILNGAECEPCINCDDALLRQSPASVLSGAQIMLRILEADRCLIALKESATHALSAVSKALEKLGDDRIAVAPVPSVYPAGGEAQLIQLLTGREVPSGGLPWDTGAICQNVGTAHAIERFLTQGEPLIRRVVTLTGEGLRQPVNMIARIGTPISELINAAGGYAQSGGRLIMGGPMMGITLPSDDLPLTKACNCIYVAAPSELSSAQAPMPCIRCGDCATVCPANLMPQLLLQAQQTSDFDKLAQLGLPDCIECGCCDYVCPSHITLTSSFRAAKQQAWELALEQRRARKAEQRFAAREARRADEDEQLEHELDAQLEQLETDTAAAALRKLMQRVDDSQANGNDKSD